METSFAWFPAAKLTSYFIVLGLTIWLFKNKHHKTNFILGGAFLIFLVLSPIKIDGTNSKTAHRIEVNKADSYHESQALAPKEKRIVTQKFTFTQRLASEEAYSNEANREIQDEIK